MCISICEKLGELAKIARYRNGGIKIPTIAAVFM